MIDSIVSAPSHLLKVLSLNHKSQMTLFIKLLLSLLLVGCAANDFLSKRGSISFENADITVAVKTANGVRVAEAFNATVGAFRPQKMRWVSLGLPRLLARTEGPKSSAVRSNQSLFEFAPGGFYAYIETLSESVAAELVKEAREKYDSNINTSQFLPIDKHIGSFSCHIDLFDSDKKDFVRIVGVAEIIANPVVVFFKLPTNYVKYNSFLKELKSPLVIKCNVESRARMHKQNVFKLSLSTIEELNLKESLFGPSSEVYVTRNQLLELARRIHKSLHIEEEYEIREERFKTEFVKGILDLATNSLFEQIDIKTEIGKLSQFGIDIREDLKPDIVYKHLNNVFTVNTTNSKEHLVLKNQYEGKQSETSDTSFRLKAEVNAFFKIVPFGVSGTIDYFNRTNKENQFKNLSVNEQLRIINSYQESDVKWAREGNMIYPKSLNVTRLHRSTFEHTLAFRRILKQNEEAAFNELISLSTDDYHVADILTESSELIRRSIMQEVIQFKNSLNNSVLIQLQQFKDSLNNSVLQQLQQSERALSSKVACSSALFDASLTNSLTLSSKQACSQFSKPGV